MRRIQLLTSRAGGVDIEQLQERVENLELATIIISTTPTQTPHQAVNILRNGDLAHSVHTWHENPPLTEGDKNKECAHWFSHAQPSANQPLDTTDSRTNAVNQTLKTSGHSTYDDSFAEWDRTIGAAKLCAGATLDAPMEQPVFRAGFTAHLVIGRIALADKYVAAPATARLFAGLYGKQNGVWGWISAAGSLDFSAVAVNPGTKEYRYRLHVRTDRGFEFISDELVVANAPDILGGGAYVQLNWAMLPNAGILSYDVYRHEPDTGEYVLLYQVSSGSNSYQDNGHTTRSVAGYPTGDFDRATAYSATAPNVLRDLAINGVSSAWDTLPFQLTLPSTFNLGQLQSSLFVRLGLSGLNPDAGGNPAFDLRLDDVQTGSGGLSVSSPAGKFTADHVGLSFRLYNTLPGSSGEVITGTVTEFVTANQVKLSAAPTWNHSRSLLIIEGGGAKHGIYVDLLHISTSSGAVYAPHIEDYTGRPQFPAALPNGSTQGGVGTPGTPTQPGDGTISCLWHREMVWRWNGGNPEQVWADNIRIGDAVYMPGVGVSQVIGKRLGTADVYLIRTENGLQERCTLSERLITSQMDIFGTAVENLNVGDFVLTVRNGRVERSRIVEKSLFKHAQRVVTLSLSAQPFFVAGGLSLPDQKRSICIRLWRKLSQFLRGETAAEDDVNGIINHNRKADPHLQIPV